MLRRQELSVTFDDINEKFGKDTMLLGRLITPNGRKWAMNQNFKSPSYLTNWEEILRVN
jgi:DNA polymerase V